MEFQLTLETFVKISTTIFLFTKVTCAMIIVSGGQESVHGLWDGQLYLVVDFLYMTYQQRIYIKDSDKTYKSMFLHTTYSFYSQKTFPGWRGGEGVQNETDG